METTKNCGLKKPGQDDFYDVQDFDDNMETIDEHIGALESPAYEESKELEELESGEPYLSVLGKIKKAVGALIAHISDKNNPHGVTLTQLGAAAADTLSRHIQNMDNPHSVTKTQVGLGKCDNTADVEKSVKYAASAGTAANATAASLAERAYALRVINPDWNGYMSQALALLRARYDGTNYVWLDADIGGEGKGGAVQHAVDADRATNATNATKAANATFATNAGSATRALMNFDSVQNTAFLSRGTSANGRGDNTNYMFDNGVYPISPNTLNIPLKQYAMLFIMRSNADAEKNGSSWIYQFWIPTSGNYVYMRRNINYTESGWTPWDCIYSADRRNRVQDAMDAGKI